MRRIFRTQGESSLKGLLESHAVLVVFRVVEVAAGVDQVPQPFEEPRCLCEVFLVNFQDAQAAVSLFLNLLTNWFPLHGSVLPFCDEVARAISLADLRRTWPILL